MAECRFLVGQPVDLKDWDATVPPYQRMGLCVVTRIESVRNCDSGWMVTVRAKDGRVRRLDQTWLSEVSE